MIVVVFAAVFNSFQIIYLTWFKLHVAHDIILITLINYKVLYVPLATVELYIYIHAKKLLLKKAF